VRHQVVGNSNPGGAGCRNGTSYGDPSPEFIGPERRAWQIAQAVAGADHSAGIAEQGVVAWQNAIRDLVEHDDAYPELLDDLDAIRDADPLASTARDIYDEETWVQEWAHALSRLSGAEEPEVTEGEPIVFVPAPEETDDE
jgi:hypothetical protein